MTDKKFIDFTPEQKRRIQREAAEDVVSRGGPQFKPVPRAQNWVDSTKPQESDELQR